MSVLSAVDAEVRGILLATAGLTSFATGGVHNSVAPATVTTAHVVWTAWPGDGDHRAVDVVGRASRILSVPSVDAKVIVPVTGVAYTAAAVAAVEAMDQALEAAGWMRQREIHYRETTSGGPVWWHLGGEYRKVIAT